MSFHLCVSVRRPEGADCLCLLQSAQMGPALAGDGAIIVSTACTGVNQIRHADTKECAHISDCSRDFYPRFRPQLRADGQLHAQGLQV